MACIQTLISCVTQGNDWFMNVTVTDDGTINTETGEPLTPKDLTGATIALTFKEVITGPVIITPSIDTTDLATGRIGFSLTAAQTEGLIGSSGDLSRQLFGAPQVTYQDGTVDDLFLIDLDVHESWN